MHKGRFRSPIGKGGKTKGDKRKESWDRRGYIEKDIERRTLGRFCNKVSYARIFAIYFVNPWCWVLLACYSSTKRKRKGEDYSAGTILCGSLSSCKELRQTISLT